MRLGVEVELPMLRGILLLISPDSFFALSQQRTVKSQILAQSDGALEQLLPAERVHQRYYGGYGCVEIMWLQS